MREPLVWPGGTRLSASGLLVEIHTDEANLPSSAIPRRLGYRLERVDQVEARTPAETGRLQVWITP